MMCYNVKEDGYEFIRTFIKHKCGLVLSKDKDYLISSRLEPIIKDFSFVSFQELCDKLSEGDDELEDRVITELTTHETYFFRDVHPFETFENFLIPWLDQVIYERKTRSYVRKGVKSNILCAACSTGQEPYSLAMLLDRASGNYDYEMEDISVMGIDVSTDVLSYAMKGKYKNFEVKRGINETPYSALIDQYFENGTAGFEVNDHIKRIVEFKYCNLIENFEYLGGFDIIFCRNVLIYFDQETKVRILKHFFNMLNDNGYLVLGSSENLYGLSDEYEVLECGETLLYRKNESNPNQKNIG